MKPLVSLSIAMVLGSLPGAAIAQVAQTYNYDANGRLTGVTTTGSGGTNTAAYVYDDADNRTSRSQTGTAAYAAILQLPADQALLPDQALVSADGRFSFALRSSGDLELRLGETLIWTNVTASGIGPVFRLSDDGSAGLHPEAPVTADTAGAFFALQNNGNLVLSDGAGSTVLWQSKTCCH